MAIRVVAELSCEEEMAIQLLDQIDSFYWAAPRQSVCALVNDF